MTDTRGATQDESGDASDLDLGEAVEPPGSTGQVFSLRTALVLRVLVPLFLVLGGAVFWLLHTVEDEAEQRLKDEVELVSRALRLPLVHAMERDRPGTVSEALRSALRIGRVYGAYVYGPDGEILASFGGAQPEGPPDRIDELVEVGDRTGEFGSLAGRRVYSSFVPLTDEWGRGLGLLQVTRRQSDFDEYIAGLRFRALGLLLLGMAVVTVLVLHGHHAAVGGPLARLNSSMSRVGSGDTEHRAEPTGPEELATLTSTFNEMLDRLQEAATELNERRRQQQALQSELAAAEKLAAIGELASGVAHELGSPLSVVDGQAQRLLRQPSSGADARTELETIRAQVRRMESIIRQLMDFGRTETGRRRVTSFEQVVRGAIGAAAEVATRTGTTIEAGHMGPGVSLRLEARRVEEAITNLLRNACQATPGGTVRIGYERMPTHVRLTIEDDGPGIPEEIRTRIFEPFFTTKPSGEGSGLGLAVAHGIVEEHEGRIDIDRSPLGGARFTIHLPDAVNDAHDAEETTERVGATDGATGRDGS
ncbi:MAG: HAMP domain-containing sensor histidine kinase [Gemmatimonadota bacterium]|nr:HAMP domain-containing sensor histidine kinase [Gemmatimonadota bacterium]